jgi:ATP-dependent Clp protease protease subunit
MSNPNVFGSLSQAHFPQRGDDPEIPWPGGPLPGRPAPASRPDPGPVPPTRVWMDPYAGWQDKLYERLLEHRVVIASGVLDEAAATRLSAQLLTLDAEGDGPIRLELQNLQSELPAALTLMGILDVVRAEIQAYAGGETGGPALGVLASCPRRLAYPNASFTLAEPRLGFTGTATEVSAREQQASRMVDSLFYRLAEATGRDVEDIREDARHGRVLTVAEAIGYGLVHDRAVKRTPLS